MNSVKYDLSWTAMKQSKNQMHRRRSMHKTRSVKLMSSNKFEVNLNVSITEPPGRPAPGKTIPLHAPLLG